MQGSFKEKGRDMVRKRSEIGNILRSRRGEAFVEATIVFPILILVVLLLIRLFVFYLEILGTQVRMHEQAFEEWDAYRKVYPTVYRDREELSLMGNGIYRGVLKKEIPVRLDLFREESIVRAGDLIEDLGE